MSPFNIAFQVHSLAQARDQGLLDSDAPGTTAAPGRRCTVTGDGKVMDSITRNTRPELVDPDTGEVLRPCRHDPAAGYHYEAGDEKNRVYGSKFVSLSARDEDDYYSRVILALEHEEPGKGHGGEAGLAVDMLLRLREEAGDGMRAAAWDGALSGVHIALLMRAGLLVVSPTKAASNPDRKRRGPGRVEKGEKLPHTVGAEAEGEGEGGCSHDLYAIGGRVHTRTVLDDGSEHFTPVPWRLLPPRRNNDGTYRWYHEIDIDCGDDFHRTTVRLHQTPADTAAKLNRPEVLRQLPPATPEYLAVYRYRPDSESLNAQLQAMFHFHRLPAYGRDGQLLAMLGATMAENAVSRQRHRKRTGQDAQDEPAAGRLARPARPTASVAQPPRRDPVAQHRAHRHARTPRRPPCQHRDRQKGRDRPPDGDLHGPVGHTQQRNSRRPDVR